MPPRVILRLSAGSLGLPPQHIGFIELPRTADLDGFDFADPSQFCDVSDAEKQQAGGFGGGHCFHFRLQFFAFR